MSELTYSEDNMASLAQGLLEQRKKNIDVDPMMVHINTDSPLINDSSTVSYVSSGASSCIIPGPVQPAMARRHGDIVLSEWHKLQYVINGNDDVILDGSSLDLPSLTAVSRYGAKPLIDKTPKLIDSINDSVRYLQEELDKGEDLYGITTGFGGSADTHTSSVKALQVALLQMQLSGILPISDDEDNAKASPYTRALSNGDVTSGLAMPEAWVRSAMLVRCNSLLRGHSAVRFSVIEMFTTLLRHNYVPLVPLRGSISASGDLSPLSYIAGLLEGNPDVFVWTGEPKSRKLMTADKALAQLNLEPVVFQAKEGLGVLNGTAVSAGVATLALHEANQLAVLSQVLTAMGVEALSGESASFDPFIAKVRPHEGQTEAAQSISTFLEGSKLLVTEHDEYDPRSLRQDRYGLRTASQWMGPQLEDLKLAHSQLATELNSTTDNPLIDVQGRKSHHGGNFQAATVTSSTEKTRLSLQMMGKMIFAQSCELLDSHFNNGLPPNLSADEPSLSYTLKGVDINMASYMAELAFLANPVSSHVQSAEMGNQGINSMALVSARYTHMATDLVFLMCSAYLYSLCQAVDLRAMHIHYFDKLRPALHEITTENLGELATDALKKTLWLQVRKSFDATRSQDSDKRFDVIAKSCQTLLLEAMMASTTTTTEAVEATETPSTTTTPLGRISAWTRQFGAASRDIFLANRVAYFAAPDATPYLGSASRRMYAFVRRELGVPFHRGLADHPVAATGAANGHVIIAGEETEKTPRRREQKKTTGSQISVVHAALRSGRLMQPVMMCLEEAMHRV